MRTYKILNVDDHEAGRYLITRQLKQAGYSVIEAASGTEALGAMAQEPDLVLLDVNLPDISGFDVCRKIKADPKHSSVVIVHLSASIVTSKDKAYGLEGGADAYLTEPIEGPELIATIRAMLRVRQAEEQTRRLALELEGKVKELESQREVRERFVNALTHDLRSPLTAAKLNAQLVVRAADATDNVRKHAVRMVSNIERVDKMIQDLLDANRIRAGEKIPLKLAECDIRKVAAEAVEQLVLLYGDRFRVVETDEHLQAQIDCGAIRRAIENLCSNAVKYGSPDGPITLTLEKEGWDVLISVHNHGNPIPSSEQGTLFQQYYRSASADQGSQIGWGIGLSLVQGISEAHGGSVSVSSSAENGTLFTMRLPNVLLRDTLEPRKSSAG